MFGWLKKKSVPPAPPVPVAYQPPNEVFLWPKGVVLTAVDAVVLALPVALFDLERPMGEFVFGSPDMGFRCPPESEVFFIKLEPGMSVSLAKSCEAYVVASDGKPRRLKPSGPGVKVPGRPADRGAVEG
jgi:hypothetical protein